MLSMRIADHDNDYVCHDENYDFTNNQMIIVVIFTRLLRMSQSLRLKSCLEVKSCSQEPWGNADNMADPSEFSKGSLDESGVKDAEGKRASSGWLLLNCINLRVEKNVHSSGLLCKSLWYATSSHRRLIHGGDQ